jgi:hypothetical protein
VIFLDKKIKSKISWIATTFNLQLSKSREVFMKEFTNPLDNIKVASPCPANWNEMFGDERKRFCSECKLNVYNLSEMTKREAENFLIEAEGRVCVKFYRRDDGTILTKDCPVGWQAVKKRVSRTAKAFVSICAGIFGGIFAFNQFQPNHAVQDENSIKVSAVDYYIPLNKPTDFERNSVPPIPQEQTISNKNYRSEVGGLSSIEYDKFNVQKKNSKIARKQRNSK